MFHGMNHSGRLPPTVICIDDDDDDENDGDNSQIIPSHFVRTSNRHPQIKTEPSHGPWWSVDHVRLSPICISDDEDEEREGNSTATSQFPAAPLQQKDLDNILDLDWQAEIGHDDPAAETDMGLAGLQPQEGASGFGQHMGFLGDDDEPGLFVDQFEPLAGLDADLDSLFSSPKPEAAASEAGNPWACGQAPMEQSLPASSFGQWLDQSDVPGSSYQEVLPMPQHPALSRPSPFLLPSTENPADVVYSWTNLHAVIDSGSPPLMAEAVRTARSSLRRLATPLKDIEERIDGPSWTQRVALLQRHTVPAPVLIGVVGRTGTGKSSVINAVLDEDRVLPTSGLRACTAVVTEIAWNASECAGERYRAEIEFVQPADWQRELTRLFADVADAGDDTADAPETGIALAKLQAVFPAQAASRTALLEHCNLQMLLQDTLVNSLLGTVRSVTAAQPEAFYSQLQAYIDGSLDGHRSPVSETDVQPSWWPLIKVVRVYLKSEALATGVVLVDLPGFGDANAARDAVAEQYIPKCAALWVVSPIARAVDDREARELLGRSFRRQLVLDGAYDSVSFICCKTDDIAVRQVAESLDTAGVAQGIASAMAALDQELAEKTQHLEALQERQRCAVELLQDTPSRLDTLQSMGREVLNMRKRKAAADVQGGTKRARPCDNAEGPGEEMDLPDDAEASLEEELGRVVQERDEATATLSSLYPELVRATEDCKVLARRRSALADERVAVCMQLRNAYSREHIKTDFAEGRRECVDVAPGEGPDAGKYADLATSLPVFCVSSRAYQRFRGRTGAEDNSNSSGSSSSSSSSSRNSNGSDGGSSDMLRSALAPSMGYRHVGETEIPQLQQHARQLGTDCVARRDRKLLVDFAHLLTSLAVWVGTSGDGFGLQIQLDAKRRACEMEHLDRAYGELKENLLRAADKFVATLRRIVETEVLQRQSLVLATCADAAPAIVDGWAQPRKNGSVLFNTYRSICRNGGFPTSARTRRNFNKELTGPLLDALAPAWDVAFGTSMPAALTACQAVADARIAHFHRRMRARPLLNLCAQNAGLGLLLDNEIRNTQHLIHEALACTRQHMDTLRRDANRLPLACLHRAMAPAYRACAQESGPGCMARMRATMAEHIQRQRQSMYASVETAMRARLTEFTDTVLQGLLLDYGDSLTSLFQDCRMMIAGTEVPEATRSARNLVEKLLEQTDAAFAADVLSVKGE